jgi:hypothetical protein
VNFTSLQLGNCKPDHAIASSLKIFGRCASGVPKALLSLSIAPQRKALQRKATFPRDQESEK